MEWITPSSHKVSQNAPYIQEIPGEALSYPTARSFVQSNTLRLTGLVFHSIYLPIKDVFAADDHPDIDADRSPEFGPGWVKLSSCSRPYMAVFAIGNHGNIHPDKASEIGAHNHKVINELKLLQLVTILVI